MENEQYFGFYELMQYATANERYKALLDYKDTYFNSLYDEIRPAITCFNEDLGKVYLSGQNTENMALWIIEQKNYYNRKIRVEQQRTELFNKALMSLSDEEQQVIKKHLKNGLNIYLHDDEYVILQQAQDKLIRFISKELREKEEREQQEKYERTKEKARILKKYLEGVK